MRRISNVAFILTGLSIGCGCQGWGGTMCKAAGTAPLQVSGDPHWLEFRGEKVLLIGDSVTQGWMELGINFDQAAYVDALASRGINVLMLWSYIGITDQVGDGRIGYDAPEIWPWVKTGAVFDLTQLNSVYFDRLRTLVQLAENKNIVVLLTIHDGWTKTRFGGHPFNQALGGPLSASSQYVDLHDYSAEMPATYNPAWTRQQKHQYFLERFCERIIQATGDRPNVIYEMFNEGEWYDQTKLRSFQVHFLRFFKSRTPRVTMVNDDHTGGASFRGEADCDVISWHKPNWDSSTSVGSAFGYYAPEFVGSPVKSFFFSEPVPEYQGNASLHDALMRLMWGTVLGGAGFVVQNDTSYGFDPRTAIAAQAVHRDIVLDREGHCARFFNASNVGFWTMTPSSTVASTGVCLTHAGHEYVVYSQSGSSFTLNMSAGAGSFNCRFYNPRTGQFGATFQRTGGSTQSFTKPDSSDWVLHVAEVPQAPVAVIQASPASGKSPLAVSFDGTGSYDTDGGSVVAYAWNFDDDEAVDASGPTATHTYQGRQRAIVRLTVTDNDGRTGTASAEIDVTTATGDFDGDGDVDQEDFAHLQRCIAGAGQLQTNPACQDAILDGDGDVDADDCAIFLACMSRPNVPSSCGG